MSPVLGGVACIIDRLDNRRIRLVIRLVNECRPYRAVRSGGKLDDKRQSSRPLPPAVRIAMRTDAPLLAHAQSGSELQTRVLGEHYLLSSRWSIAHRLRG